MRERVKLKLSLLYCTVESVESVLGSVEPTFKPPYINRRVLVAANEDPSSLFDPTEFLGWPSQL